MFIFFDHYFILNLKTSYFFFQFIVFSAYVAGICLDLFLFLSEFWALFLDFFKLSSISFA